MIRQVTFGFLISMMSSCIISETSWPVLDCKAAILEIRFIMDAQRCLLHEQQLLKYSLYHYVYFFELLCLDLCIISVQQITTRGQLHQWPPLYSSLCSPRWDGNRVSLWQRTFVLQLYQRREPRTNQDFSHYWNRILFVGWIYRSSSEKTWRRGTGSRRWRHLTRWRRHLTRRLSSSSIP